jgi:hypothetical protein
VGGGICRGCWRPGGSGGRRQRGAPWRASAAAPSSSRGPAPRCTAPPRARTWIMARLSASARCTTCTWKPSRAAVRCASSSMASMTMWMADCSKEGGRVFMYVSYLLAGSRGTST